MSLSVRDGENNDRTLINSKNDVEGKPLKYRPAKMVVKGRIHVGQSGDAGDQALQFIQETDRRASVSLRIPTGSVLGILNGARMETDRS